MSRKPIKHAYIKRKYTYKEKHSLVKYDKKKEERHNLFLLYCVILNKNAEDNQEDFLFFCV